MTTSDPVPYTIGNQQSDEAWEKETMDALQAKYHVEMDTELDNVIVIDHIPVVPEEKIPKLLLVLKKIMGTFGGAPLPEDHERIIIPTESDGNNGVRTRGICIVEYPNEQQATRALHEAESYRLDKSHVFTARRFTDIDQLANLPDTFVPPPKEQQEEMEHLRWWCRDLAGRDQFALRYADETAVYWNQKNEKPELVYSRAQWTDSLVQWSPLGTYLTTFHRPGIALWAGDSWKKMVRFAHQQVKHIQFSPQEHYVFTYSTDIKSKDDMNCILWDVRTGLLLKSFHIDPTVTTQWPIFQWNHSEEYFSRTIDQAIEVYSIDKLKEKDALTVIPITDVQSSIWSPTDSIIAYWTPETGNTPARVTLLSFPAKTIVRTKNLFNVNLCTLQWQSHGDYLGVLVDRFTKSKKSFFSNIEVFHVKEKDVPVEVYELKERMTSFSWEPNGGDAWICIGGEMPKTSVYLFSLDNKKNNIVLIKMLERRSVSDVFWSPKGQFVVMAGLRTTTGLIEFWNTLNPNGQRELELLHSTEHYQVTSVEWDPTGRYVSTVVSALFHPSETGYHMHEFHGKPMFRQQLDKFYQLQWRPRPPTLLSSSQLKEIKKNLKQYAGTFDAEDQAASSHLSQQVLADRKMRAIEWKAFTLKKKARFEQVRGKRRQLRNGATSDVEEDTQIIEEIIEEVVDEKIETE